MVSQETSLIQDLSVPIKSFRLFAYEEAIRIGQSPVLLEALIKQRECEDDEECRLLLDHAISTLKAKIGSTRDEKKPDISLEMFSRHWASLESPQKLQLLSGLSPNVLRNLAPQVPNLFSQEPQPIVAASLLRVFGKYWPEDRFPSLLEKLFAPALSIRLATLDFLVKRSPRLLLEHLPKLLSSDDPRVRALSIRGLADIDLEEAVEHSRLMLFGPDKTEKLAAIQNLLFLPFESIKSLLLSFFAAELDVELLQRSGTLFAMNADPEIPYKLWEIAENSPSEKAAVIKTILKSSCEVIEKMGFYREDNQPFSKRLQEWIYQRAALRFVQECLAHFETQEAYLQVELMALIAQKLENPSVREAFEKALDWPLSEKVQTALQGLLQPKEKRGSASVVASQEPSPANCSPPTFWDLSPEEKIRKVASWQPEDRKEAEPLIEKVLQHEATPLDLRSTTLRAALRLGIPGFCSQAQRWVTLKDPNVVSASLEYLGVFEKEHCFLLLGKFLKDPNPRLKTTALRILQKHDPHQGVSSLLALLKTKEDESKHLALGCMLHFDFSLVRLPLTEFLKATPSQRLLAEGLCLFQANVDSENGYLLYSIEKSRPLPEDQHLVKRVRLALNQALESMGMAKKGEYEKREAEWAKKWAMEEARKNAPIPAYAVQRTVGIPKNALQEMASQLIGEGFLQSPRAFLALFVAVSLLFWFLSPSAPNTTLKVNQSAPLIADCFRVNGTIVQKLGLSGPILLKSEKGETFQIFANTGEFRNLNVGDSIEAVIIPFRKTQDNVILCRYKTLEKK